MLFKKRGRLLGPGVLARLVAPGFLRKEVTVNPGEAAVLIKGGKIEDVRTQTQINSEGWDEMLLILTTPFELEVPLSAATKDYAVMNGTLSLRFQLSQTQAPKILGLVQPAENGGGSEKILTEEILRGRIASELTGGVVNPFIAQYNRSEFHGNMEVIRNLEATVDVEMRKTFDLWGLNLLKLWTNWQYIGTAKPETRVHEVMHKGVVAYTTPTETVSTLWRRMQQKRVSSLVVLEGGRLVGIVTRWDVQKKAQGKDWRRLQARDVMSPSPVTIGPEETLRSAIFLLNQRRIWTLPVLDGGRLVGILTMADVKRWFRAKRSSPKPRRWAGGPPARGRRGGRGGRIRNAHGDGGVRR